MNSSLSHSMPGWFSPLSLRAVRHSSARLAALLFLISALPVCAGGHGHGGGSWHGGGHHYGGGGSHFGFSLGFGGYGAWPYWGWGGPYGYDRWGYVAESAPATYSYPVATGYAPLELVNVTAAPASVPASPSPALAQPRIRPAIIQTTGMASANALFGR